VRDGNGVLPAKDSGVILGDGGIAASTSFTLSSPLTGALPFTVGLGFKKGDVPATFALDLPQAQVDVKRRWSDGSVKHAIVSARWTSPPARRAREDRWRSYSGGTALTCLDIQGAAPSASVSLSAIGTVSLSALLSSPVRTGSRGQSGRVPLPRQRWAGPDPARLVLRAPLPRWGDLRARGG